MNSRNNLVGALALAAASPTGAFASCEFPSGTTSSPRHVAELLLQRVDVIGFGIIEQRQDVAKRQPEIVNIVFPVKGEPGRLSLALEFERDALIVTNASTSFEAPEGTLVFAALHKRPTGAAIGECTIQLMSKYPREEIIGAIYEAARYTSQQKTVRFQRRR